MRKMTTSFRVLLVASAATAALVSTIVYAGDKPLLESQIEMAKNPKADRPKVVAGTYENYGLFQGIQIAATLVANPSRLETVSVADVYKLDDIQKNSPEWHAALQEASQGSVGFGKVSENGDIEVVSYSKLGSKFWEDLKLECASGSKQCSAVISNALEVTPDKIEIVAAPNTFGISKADRRAINWEAKKPSL